MDEKDLALYFPNYSEIDKKEHENLIHNVEFLEA